MLSPDFTLLVSLPLPCAVLAIAHPSPKLRRELLLPKTNLNMHLRTRRKDFRKNSECPC